MILSHPQSATRKRFKDSLRFSASLSDNPQNVNISRGKRLSRISAYAVYMLINMLIHMLLAIYTLLTNMIIQSQQRLHFFKLGKRFCHFPRDILSRIKWPHIDNVDNSTGPFHTTQRLDKSINWLNPINRSIDYIYIVSQWSIP